MWLDPEMDDMLSWPFAAEAAPGISPALKKPLHVLLIHEDEILAIRSEALVGHLGDYLTCSCVAASLYLLKLSGHRIENEILH